MYENSIGSKIAIMKLITTFIKKLFIPILGNRTLFPAVMKQCITYISKEYLPIIWNNFKLSFINIILHKQNIEYDIIVADIIDKIGTL